MKMKLVLFSLAALVTQATKIFAEPDPNFYVYPCFA